jgi:hypothetical protein
MTKVQHRFGVGLLISLIGIFACTGLGHSSSALAQTSNNPCPKLLMFGGLDIQTHLNETQARYWGQEIGIQGFFVNNVMAHWKASVGDDEKSPGYQRLKQFQELYSKYGVADNFIKVAMYKPHDWRDPVAQDRVVSNFRQAAHLARYAGLKGLALDLEPYKPTWNQDAAIPDKAERVFLLGRRVGGAILSEFPEATIIVLPEILEYTCPPFSENVCQAYALSSRFWDGLIQGHLKQLIIASEHSYNSSRPDLIADSVAKIYHENLIGNGIDPESVPIALGIWPLGKTYTDKSARCTPPQFEERLRLAVQVKSPYVWIYGHGSAWQSDGPYGKGSVDPHFSDFVRVIHQVKEQCAKAH